MRSTLLLLLALVFVGCDSSNPTGEIQAFPVDFSQEPDDWNALFSNYGVGREEEFQLARGYRTLPPPLDTTDAAFFLSGDNLSDDLNMFLKHQVSGLEPGRTYSVAFDVSFATDAPSGCAGVGGSPGKSVTVHAAASADELERVIDRSTSSPYYRLNAVVNYEGEEDWYSASEIGDVANSRSCDEKRQYELKRVQSGSAHWTVEADEEGRAWVYVGTRSGFEAKTSLYYTRVRPVFRPE